MNKRLLLLFTLTFCMLIPTSSLAFQDVKGHWAEETINHASEYRNCEWL